MRKPTEIVQLADGKYMRVRQSRRYESILAAQWTDSCDRMRWQLLSDTSRAIRSEWTIRVEIIVRSWAKRHLAWNRRKNAVNKKRTTWKAAVRRIHSQWLTEIDRANSIETKWKQWVHNRVTNYVKRETEKQRREAKEWGD